MRRFSDIRVREILSEKLGVSLERIVDDAHFVNDLGADSLDQIEVIMALEDEYDIDIPDPDADEIKTVGDAISYMKKTV